jgi:hypothetical protein
VILISVRETTDPEEQKNPYRTGGWVVVKEEAVERIFDPASAKAVLKRRMAFVTDETWDQLGIPRGAVEGVPSE